MTGVILNDLSFPAEGDPGKLAGDLSKLLEGLATLIVERVVERSLGIPESLYDLGPISLDHLQILLEKEEKEFLWSLEAKCPPTREISTDILYDLYGCQWIGESGDESDVFTQCAVTGALVASLRTAEKWQTDMIRGQLLVLEDNADLHEQSCDLNHFSSLDEAELVCERRQYAVLGSVSRATFERDATRVFPYLRFGVDVPDDVARLGPTIFEAVKRRLAEYNATVKAWRESGENEPRFGSHVRGESKTTMNKFGDERRRRDPEGERALYELHGSLPNGHRVHLRILHDKKAIEIGYVGTHLRTVQFSA